MRTQQRDYNMIQITGDFGLLQLGVALKYAFKEKSSS
jgi:hypothetical protein